jgi:mannose-6-phosphate isomerase
MLHDLWVTYREELFGPVKDAPRFPLLLKLLDAHDKLSLQVHPPARIAAALGSEAKTEFWYVMDAQPEAEIFVGLREPIAREQFQEAIGAGTVESHLHAIRVKAGDAMFLPAGRFHAIGAGNILVEVQQNSDTTYRVFDWNRTDDHGKTRTLHIDQALQSIDFTDCRPDLVRPDGEQLIRHDLFEIQKWQLDQPREIAPLGEFAIVCCLQGAVRCAGSQIGPAEFFLVPAQLKDRRIEPAAAGTSLLRVTIPV